MWLIRMNDVSAKSFTRYLAQSQRNHFVRSLSKSHYFSFLMDGKQIQGKWKMSWSSSFIANRMMLSRRSGLVLDT